MKSDSAIRFTVFGVPVPWGRARLNIKGRHFTPKKTRDWEKLVRDNAALAMEGRPAFDGVVSVTITFFMPVPASWSKAKRQAAHSSPHARRPDLDNLAKAILDAMGAHPRHAPDGVVFKDDGQIASLYLEKRYTVEGEDPCVYVLVRQLGRRL